MTTREVLLWLDGLHGRLGKADRPDMPLEELLAQEKQARDALGRWLFYDGAPPASLPPPLVEIPCRSDVADYLKRRRVEFSRKLVISLCLPYSPCRVRDWQKERHLHWLLIVSWLSIGAREWEEMERLRQVRDSFQA